MDQSQPNSSNQNEAVQNSQSPDVDLNTRLNAEPVKIVPLTESQFHIYKKKRATTQWASVGALMLTGFCIGWLITFGSGQLSTEFGSLVALVSGLLAALSHTAPQAGTPISIGGIGGAAGQAESGGQAAIPKMPRIDPIPIAVFLVGIVGGVWVSNLSKQSHAWEETSRDTYVRMWQPLGVTWDEYRRHVISKEFPPTFLTTQEVSSLTAATSAAAIRKSLQNSCNPEIRNLVGAYKDDACLMPLKDMLLSVNKQIAAPAVVATPVPAVPTLPLQSR